VKSARNRIVALAAAALTTLIAGVAVALPSHTATAAPRPSKPVAVAESFSVQMFKLDKYARPIPEPAPAPATYTVQSGDTLSKISRTLWNDASAWPALWYANKSIVPNPAAIKPGQVLTEPADHSVPSWMLQQALAAIPQSAPAPVVTTSASTPAPAPAPTGSLQSYALSLLGGNSTQFSCLNSVIMIESSWNPYAANASGAYGIPQALPGSKMAAAGSDWATNGDTQLRWMIQMYIPGTYGTPCGAWAHEQAFGWY